MKVHRLTLLTFNFTASDSRQSGALVCAPRRSGPFHTAVHTAVQTHLVVGAAEEVRRLGRALGPPVAQHGQRPVVVTGSAAASSAAAPAGDASRPRGDDSAGPGGDGIVPAQEKDAGVDEGGVVEASPALAGQNARAQAQ